MLSFNNVSTFYGKIQALHDVSIDVQKGEIVTLIGANGAGNDTVRQPARHQWQHPLYG